MTQEDNELIYEYIGNYSAVDPAYSKGMSCRICKVSWTGCWDNYQCPKCGEGELPSYEDNFSAILKELAMTKIDEIKYPKYFEDFMELTGLHKTNGVSTGQITDILTFFTKLELEIQAQRKADIEKCLELARDKHYPECGHVTDCNCSYEKYTKEEIIKLILGEDT